MILQITVSLTPSLGPRTLDESAAGCILTMTHEGLMIRKTTKTPKASYSSGTMHPELLGHERPNEGMGGIPI